jgi:F0F1-type ATP synthase membrane subunit a
LFHLDVPSVLIPPLIVIEIISHIAKIFSLSIRLFANIMAGHILLHILTGFILQLSKINLVLGFFLLLLFGLLFF